MLDAMESGGLHVYTSLLDILFFRCVCISRLIFLPLKTFSCVAGSVLTIWCFWPKISQWKIEVSPPNLQLSKPNPNLGRRGT